MTVELVLLQVPADQQSIVGAVLVFLVNLIVGTIGITAGARLIIDNDSGFGWAAVTALIGAIVWAVVAFFFGWIPLLGPLLALLAWIGVINWRYEGGWGSAIAIGLVAWIVSVVLLWLLAFFGIAESQALGIPGV